MDYLINAWDTSAAPERCNCMRLHRDDGIIPTVSKVKNRVLCIYCEKWVKDLTEAGIIKLKIDNNAWIHCWVKKPFRL